MHHRSSAFLLPVLVAIVGACGPHLRPLDEMPEARGKLEERTAYLEQHPGLDQPLYDAIYDGRAVPGMDAEQLTLLLSEPDAREELEGLFDEEWSYHSPRDTTWVFFKGSVVSAIDGTAPIHRFPEIQRKRVVLRFVLPRRQTMVVSLYDAQRRPRGELLHGTLEPGAHELVLKMLEPKEDPLPLRSTAPLRAGRHEIRWNARDADGEALPDGLYFLRLESTDRKEFRRFSLIQ